MRMSIYRYNDNGNVKNKLNISHSIRTVHVIGTIPVEVTRLPRKISHLLRGNI